jgi:PST family polysaccharide transporter
MLKDLKRKLIGTDEKKRLAGNIYALGILQAANYILPFLPFPHLVRVLGPEYFGLLAFASATITYFTLLTDYGFNLSATRQISLHRDDRDKVDAIYSSVMIIKTVLMFVSFLLMALLVFSFEKFSQDWKVFFLTFGLVFGQVYFPIWLFQGMERMKYITLLSIGSKVFFTLCVFVFVQDQSDYILVPLISAIGWLAVGILSMYLVKKEFDVSFRWQKSAEIKFQLVEGWHVFFSSMTISIYTISATFVLGSFTSNEVVGYFAAADKIVQAAKGLYQPVSQALFPLISKKLQEDKQQGLSFLRKTFWLVCAAMSIISAHLFIFADPLIYFLLGADYQKSVMILKIMAFLPLLIALSNIYGIQTMLNLGYKKAFSRIVVSGAILGVGLSLVLVPMYEGLGSAFTMLVVEVFVTLSMCIYLNKKLKSG